MKNYEKIPFDQISNIESYVEEKLKAGHIIIQILFNDDRKEIFNLVSYANDKECQSYYWNIADSEEQLKTSVIEEDLDPYYAFKDDEKEQDVHTADIDIETDCQYIVDFQSVIKDFASMEKKYYNEERFQDDGVTMHYEFYISTGKGDIGNFGGSMELDFVEEWMTEHGYYSK